MRNELYVSKSLREVWKWKDEAYREVAHLPVREALETLLRNAEKSSRELGFSPTMPVPRRVVVVAEAKAEYVTKKRQHK